MFRNVTTVLAALLIAVVPTVQAQSSRPQFEPAFEVASIRPSTSRGKNKSTNVDTSPGNLTITNVTLQSLVRWAYGSGEKTLPDYQVSGLPDWASVDVYDVTAKAASSVSERDQYRVMLRSLLAERFKLVVHSENKQLPVYILNLGKSPLNVTPSTVLGNVGGIQLIPEGMAFRSASMSEVADFLAGLPAFDRPVLDRTGLDGRFDFTLPMVLEKPSLDQPQTEEAGFERAINDLALTDYSYALNEVGFTLELGRAAMEIVVIDHAEKPDPKLRLMRR